MPDREKYIEILSKAAKTVKEFSEDTPIKISLECIEDILAMLKEQEAVVRCKDCKFEEVCCRRLSNNPNWFCADGKRAVK